MVMVVLCLHNLGLVQTGDWPVGEREDGGGVSWRGGELREGNRGVPAGKYRDGGVLSWCPHKH